MADIAETNADIQKSDAAEVGTRERIISAGAEIVRYQGFMSTGIKEILDAAGVPKGSFYFYFKNKEDFGLALVEHYAQFLISRLSHCLVDASDLKPLDRLGYFFAFYRGYLSQDGYRGGCPIGNLAQETADTNERFASRLTDVMAEAEALVAGCLEEASKDHKLRRGLDPASAASFVMNSWQGSLLRMKALHTEEPLIIFEREIFGFLER